MNYQVWSKEEYGELWKKVDCEDIAAAKSEIDKAVRAGGEPILTVEVPYELGIKIQEVGSEVKESKTKSDKGPRAKSDGNVRGGDEGDTPKLD